MDGRSGGELVVVVVLLIDPRMPACMRACGRLWQQQAVLPKHGV
jgi:hypothetical protein